MSNRPTYRANDRAGLHAHATSASRRALVVIASPVASAIGHMVRLSDAPSSLSRLADDIVEDDWMSREHASARLVAGVAVVRDGSATATGWKSSANGTFAFSMDLRDESRVSEVEVPVRGVIRTGRTLWMHVANPAPAGDSHLVGISEALGHIRDELALIVAEVALRMERKTRVKQSLLVTGARGSGKQVVAREAHRLLAAKLGATIPFIDVPAPALGDGTVGADIFGVVDKYATNVKARPGYFERAHGGVLLIDEVADLPLAEQAKLLNLLEERQVTRLGGRAPIAFDALVIAATNRDLDELVAANTFRADLLDRIGRFRVHLPPLGDRPEDVLLTAKALLARQSFSGVLSWEVALDLLRRPWRGNVRELDSFIERLVVLARATGSLEIDRAMCDKAARALKSTSPVQLPVGPITGPISDPKQKIPKRAELLQALLDNDWNKTEVGRRYGKHPRQITRWMEYLQISRPTD